MGCWGHEGRRERGRGEGEREGRGKEREGRGKEREREGGRGEGEREGEGEGRGERERRGRGEGRRGRGRESERKSEREIEREMASISCIHIPNVDIYSELKAQPHKLPLCLHFPSEMQILAWHVALHDCEILKPSAPFNGCEWPSCRMCIFSNIAKC